MRRFEYRIPIEQHGVTIGNYLRREQGYSRRIITRLKQQPGTVTRNALPARMVDRLSCGDTLCILLSDTSRMTPNGMRTVPVLYEDDDLMIFRKPPDMPVHPSPNHRNDTLGNYFTYYMEQAGLHAVFRPINRLDRDTDGLCLVAKNALSARKLSGQVEKEYTAILCGHPPGPSGVIDAPIARVPGSLMMRQVSPDGKESLTRYIVLQENNGYTAVCCSLPTGRTHQIRVHFSHIGLPLAGDSLYGGRTADIQRQALCCTRLRFLHPETGQQVNICINIPDDMNKLLE